ncbi:uncharacterized protein LOC104906564 [Beta vulgaris subsp. vulgaris]|uniref:uncharacterized protein LOC104906564 n=1 Tax=Beta vulgaris subsp. vulgaris TaxID=3555 RepID=UPI00254964FA|nr:uncharacterized protein LOC104906564 [Beta vulgaris subsp. vulgaris]
MHILGSPNQNSQSHYPQHNLNFSNPNSFTQFPPNSTEKFQYSQSDSVFPMSQHFQSSVGGEPLPEFDTSLRSRATSVEDDDDDDVEDKIEDNDGEDGDTQAEKTSRQFWSHAEEEVLVKSWLQASTDKYVGTNQKGNTFWGKETSGQSDDDVMKTAFAIYKSDSKKHAEFQDKHCWGILRGADQWKPIGSTVKKCKKKTETQEGGSKRIRINEDGNFSTSTDQITPTSGDVGCSFQPPSDGSVKNKGKGKGKVMNIPPEAFQQWVDSVSEMNLSRTSETEMELARLKHDRDIESERVQLEREKVLVKQRKINLELFKVLSSKAYLIEQEEELKNNLVKVLFP